MVGAHTCGFDLLMLALAKAFPGMQALSHAQPVGGMQMMNELRSKFGLSITPITSRSLRKAIRSLKQGGMVAIAADLPDPKGHELMFFKRPCTLPVGHARLALSTGARILVGLSHRAGDGIYIGEGEFCDLPVPECQSKAYRVRGMAQRCISLIEDFIRLRPDQWFMPHPIWT